MRRQLPNLRANEGVGTALSRKLYPLLPDYIILKEGEACRGFFIAPVILEFQPNRLNETVAGFSDPVCQPNGPPFCWEARNRARLRQNTKHAERSDKTLFRKPHRDLSVRA